MSRLADADRFRSRLGVVCGLAAALRLTYVVVVTADQPLAGDAGYYSAQGLALAQGRGFAHPYHFAQTMAAADHPPLASLVMALGPLVAGDDGTVAGLPTYVLLQRLTMVVVGVMVVAVIALVGRRLVDDRVGLVAGALAAVHPALWISDGLVMSESVAALTLAVVLWFAVGVADGGSDQPSARPSVWGWLALGASVGVAALARSESVLLAPVMVAPMAVMGAVRRRRHGVPNWSGWFVARAATAGVACLAVVSVWLVPNALRFQETTLFSTNDGLTWLGANCAATYTGATTGLWSLDCLSEIDSDDNGRDDLADLADWSPYVRVDEDQSEVSRRYQRAAFEFIGDHRSELPRVATVRVLRTWGLWNPAQMVERDRGEGRNPAVSWAALIGSFILVPLSLVGLVRLWRSGRPVWPLASQAVVVTVVSAAIYGLFRFRLGWDVAACVAAAVGVVALVDRRNRSELTAHG